MSAHPAKSIITIVKQKFRNGKSQRSGWRKKGLHHFFQSIDKRNFSYIFSHSIGCYQKNSTGNTEIKNVIGTEKTDFLDLVRIISLKIKIKHDIQRSTNTIFTFLAYAKHSSSRTSRLRWPHDSDNVPSHRRRHEGNFQSSKLKNAQNHICFCTEINIG